MTDAIPRGEIPHDLESERSVLSTLFLVPDKIDAVVDKLASDDFFLGPHRLIFATMRKLYAEQKPVTRASVADELKREGLVDAVGGLPYLHELMEYETSPVALEYRVDCVKNKALQRKLLEAAQYVIQDGMAQTADVDQLLRNAEERFFHLLEERYRPTYATIEKIVADVYQAVKQRSLEESTVIGVETGFTDLDTMMSGLHRSNLVIIAARPSMGKTALALNIATNAALRKGTKVVLFSLEMSKEELGYRLLASEARIDAKRIREGRISSQRDTEQFLNAVTRLSNAPIIVDDTPALQILDLRARARRLRKEGLCDLVVVDYLQMVRGTGNEQSREQEIASISRTLKAVAKELDIPVVALSQLNRGLEQRKDKRPVLSDLRESGAIEQDADVILFIHREEYFDRQAKDKNIAEIIIGKQRNGPVGTVRVAFFPEYTRFENLKFEGLGPALPPPGP